MHLTYLLRLSLYLTTAVVSTTAVFALDNKPLQLAVTAPTEGDHFAWATARQLQHTAENYGISLTIEQVALTDSAESPPALFVIPVRSLATQVAALQILELPFFYPSLEAVHQRLDGALGQYLAGETRKNGWEILAYWDEGMHIFSGLKRYDRARNLKAREFLITRPDPVAEQQFRYWKADARRIDPMDRQTVLRECLIASRATTLQQIIREQLYRVHLSMSLTNHRYEGWVVIAAAEHWAQFDQSTKKRLTAALRQTTDWQRKDRQKRENAALHKLKKSGMTIHEVDSDEREAFRKKLPAWQELLPENMNMAKKSRLIELALTGATTIVGPVGASDTRRNPAPGTETR